MRYSIGLVIGALLTVAVVAATVSASDTIGARVEVTTEDVPETELAAELNTSLTPELGAIVAPFAAKNAAGSGVPAGQTRSKPLWVWVKGSLQTRDDLFYRSVEIKTWAWVTEGPKATDPKVEVDNLEASFSEVCDGTKSRAWANEDYNGFRFFRRQRGLPPPGTGFCFPKKVCWIGCATENGVRGCAKTKDCPNS